MPTIPLLILGPNPAAFSELLWWLAARGDTVPSAWVVLESARALHYWNLEMMGPGRAYEQLLARYGERLPAPEAVRVLLPGNGELPADGFAAGLAEALAGPLWEAARGAQGVADGAVLFALAGGRWRGSNALMTAVFQMLARSQDRLVDVRVNDPRAEGGTGFFFPEQPRPWFAKRTVEPALPPGEVQVLVEELPMPRLRPLIAGVDELGSLEAAVQESQRCIERLELPRLVLDLTGGWCEVSGRRLELARTDFLLFACLVAAARTQEPWVDSVPRSGPWRPLAFMRAHSVRGWTVVVAPVFSSLITDKQAELAFTSRDTVSATWTRMRKRVREVTRDVRGAEWLIPVKQDRGLDGGRGGAWSIKLPKEQIEIRGLVEGWDPLGS